MRSHLPSSIVLQKLLQRARRLPLATQNYPSRGQTAVQELYHTKIGKLFVKTVSPRNLQECQITLADGGLAEREWWAYRLADYLKLRVPPLRLLSRDTTVQRWFDIPDARQFTTHQGQMQLRGENILECGLFDWLTGQIDRHDANYLYDFSHQQIILIDSGHAFLQYDGSLPDYLRFFEATAQHVLDRAFATPIARRLRQLTSRTLRRLVPLLNPTERAALQRRCEEAREAKTIRDIINFYRG